LDYFLNALKRKAKSFECIVSPKNNTNRQFSSTQFLEIIFQTPWKMPQLIKAQTGLSSFQICLWNLSSISWSSQH
jgi:hypothetical protein